MEIGDPLIGRLRNGIRMSDDPIPPNSAIIKEAVDLVEKERTGTLSGEPIRVCFSDYVKMLSEAAYETYEKYAAEAREAIIAKRVGRLKDTYSRDEVADLIRKTIADAARVNQDRW